jgi:uncharacterized protein YjbJ (UPF0337 family)
MKATKATTIITTKSPIWAHKLLYCESKEEGIHMKDSTKDKVEGTVHEVKGKVKEKVGHATNNPDLEDEGTAEKVAGKVQKKVGDVEKVLEK